MPAAAGEADARAAALAEQVGAEFDRRLDAKLTALGLTGRMPTANPPGLPADVVPRVRARPRVHRLPRQPLWFGIVIGSVVSGAAAVIVGVGISDSANPHLRGSENYIYIPAAGDILAWLAAAWAVLLVACVAHALVVYARDRPRA